MGRKNIGSIDIGLGPIGRGLSGFASVEPERSTPIPRESMRQILLLRMNFGYLQSPLSCTARGHFRVASRCHTESP